MCGAAATPRLAAATPHFGEEPFFTGTHGSGTLFLAGCPCQCIHCQNWQISSAPLGDDCPEEALLHTAEQLIQRGVHNLNIVTPDHHWPHIRSLIQHLRQNGLSIPVIFNTSGYHRPELIDDYARHIDIFLPDFKSASSDLTTTILNAPDYPSLALQALRNMVDAKGFLHPFQPDGKTLAREGVLVRHLVLPGHVAETIQTLELLRQEFGRFLPIALMSQYHPVPRTQNTPPFNRALHETEYRQAVEHLLALGFENILIQSDFGDNTFQPDFTHATPFPLK